MHKAPAEDQCCMGGTLGDDYRCWAEALPSGLWCAACQRDIDHDTKGSCRCPGCLRDFMAEVAANDQRLFDAIDRTAQIDGPGPISEEGRTDG